MQENSQGTQNRLVQLQSGLTQKFVQEEHKNFRRFAEVHEKMQLGQTNLGQGLASLHADFSQKMHSGEKKNIQRFSEVHTRIQTCQEGMQTLLEGQAEISRVCKKNALQADMGAHHTQEQITNSHMALLSGFHEIAQKTDSIADAITALPALKSQVEVLQTKVVSL